MRAKGSTDGWMRWMLAALMLAVMLSALVFEAATDTKLVTRKVEAAELPTVVLSSPITGFTQPVNIAHAGDGSGRLFVVEQGGLIKIVRNGAVLPTPFLNITTRISTGGERGLLGLAFPPGFADKQYFYINYTNTAGHTVVARYRVSAANPDVADAGSEQVVLSVAQPFANHNGGHLAFSPRDGYLYIALGDGGSAGDPGNRAQNPAQMLGKILRIDTETGNPATYIVPPSNPFVNRGAEGFRPEIWALGFRNPWRYSFDRETGDLYLGDVGQGTWEEIDFQSFFSNGGENYGWRIMEGKHCFDPPGCAVTGLTLPVWEYNHSQGSCSVTGGYVYRGGKYPRMQGLYFYGDFCSGIIWGLRQENGLWTNNLLLDTAINISSFGEDEAGNLYVAGLSNGTVYQLTDTQAATSTVQFDSADYFVTEACTAKTITATRTGATATPATVDFRISDGTARQKSDYTFAAGTLSFGAGETSKTFAILITDDAFAEGDERATLTLTNPTGGLALGDRSAASLVINDNETVDGTTNPIDDAGNFVCQHYHDFLNRQSDSEGQNFWVSQIAACGGDAACLDDRRESVSAAFFLSIEFQQTGYLVYRFEKTSFARLPRYESFMRDVRRVSEGVIVGQDGWQARLEANRQALAREWVVRPEFAAKFPETMTPAQFVDKLFENSEASFSLAEREAALAAYGGGGTEGRARALLSVSESDSVYNKQYNPAFVLMQYFGYLRRNPNDAPEPSLDFAGFNFWLGKLNEFSRPDENVRDDSVAFGRVRRAQMVRSFLVSTEYRERFGRP